MLDAFGPGKRVWFAVGLATTPKGGRGSKLVRFGLFSKTRIGYGKKCKTILPSHFDPCYIYTPASNTERFSWACLVTALTQGAVDECGSRGDFTYTPRSAICLAAC